jgi:hypothetical protein
MRRKRKSQVKRTWLTFAVLFGDVGLLMGGLLSEGNGCSRSREAVLEVEGRGCYMDWPDA